MKKIPVLGLLLSLAIIMSGCVFQKGNIDGQEPNISGLDVSKYQGNVDFKLSLIHI